MSRSAVITDDEQLRQALHALRLLRSLWQDVGVRNPRNFAVMAEGALDEIARISADVSAYRQRSR